MEAKGQKCVEIEFFGKIILCSNNERNFIFMDQAEIRYWIRKVLLSPKIGWIRIYFVQTKIMNTSIPHSEANEIRLSDYFPKAIFWDVNLAQLDYREDTDYIISRVLDWGNTQVPGINLNCFT